MRKAESNRRVFLKKSVAISTGLMATGLSFPTRLFAKPTIKLPKRIVFIGDSITMAGDYINLFEYYIRLRYPNWRGEILNMGLSSETASGLSEPAHPFPRPYIHNRLRNVLRTTQPDLVFVCYGMNCGIYHPFAKDRFDAYKAGILGIVNQVRTIGANLVLLTPPPFAHKGSPKTQLNQNEDYSYAKPFEAYDQVLKGYGTWIQGQFNKDFPVIDLHTAISPFKDLCYGNDIIHPNEYGHFLMAHAILQGVGLNKTHNIKLKAATTKEGESQAINFTFSQIAQKVIFDQPTEKLKSQLADLNDIRLKVKGLKPQDTYALKLAPDVVIQDTGKAWQKGISISSEMGHVQLPTVPAITKLWELIVNKRAIYDRALLNEIGHGRPDVKSVPLNEAQQIKAKLDRKLRTLKINSSIITSITSV